MRCGGHRVTRAAAVRHRATASAGEESVPPRGRPDPRGTGPTAIRRQHDARRRCGRPESMTACARRRRDRAPAQGRRHARRSDTGRIPRRDRPTKTSRLPSEDHAGSRSDSGTRVSSRAVAAVRSRRPDPIEDDDGQPLAVGRPGGIAHTGRPGLRTRRERQHAQQNRAVARRRPAIDARARCAHSAAVRRARDAATARGLCRIEGEAIDRPLGGVIRPPFLLPSL